jgi:hypothetical protein
MLRLDFAYARRTDAISGSPVEAVRVADRRSPAAPPQDVGDALAPLGDRRSLRITFRRAESDWGGRRGLDRSLPARSSGRRWDLAGSKRIDFASVMTRDM